MKELSTEEMNSVRGGQTQSAINTGNSSTATASQSSSITQTNAAAATAVGSGGFEQSNSADVDQIIAQVLGSTIQVA